ncbi:hypothetical protein CPC08DRAFT_226896 [Agrocybe pediades]|nr:hypothetical protein CPC08DRAFT_226896 [Agrocybe pediades]
MGLLQLSTASTSAPTGTPASTAVATISAAGHARLQVHGPATAWPSPLVVFENFTSLSCTIRGPGLEYQHRLHHQRLLRERTVSPQIPPPVHLCHVVGPELRDAQPAAAITTGPRAQYPQLLAHSQRRAEEAECGSCARAELVATAWSIAYEEPKDIRKDDSDVDMDAQGRPEKAAPLAPELTPATPSTSDSTISTLDHPPKEAQQLS